MDQNTANVLLATVPAGVSAVITYLVTRHQYSAHFTQRWWERKAQTYDAIMGALGRIDFVLGEWEQHFTLGIRLSEEYQSTLAAQRTEAIEVLKKLGATGDFLITEPAAVALRKAAGVLDLDLGFSDGMSEVEKDLKAVAACLATIKAEAKADLRY